MFNDDMRIYGYESSKYDDSKADDVSSKSSDKAEDADSVFSLPEVPESGSAYDLPYVPSAGSTRDGVIKNTKQGVTLDCGLLSAVTSMSYSDTGKNLLKNMFEYHYGATVVHLSVGDYTVDDSQVEKYRRTKRTSNGDEDMAILEIAVEKAVDDIVRGNLKVDDNAPFDLKSLSDRNFSTMTKSSINSVYPSAMYYLLTGKTGEYISDYRSMIEKLNEFKKEGGNNLVMTASSDFEDGYIGHVGNSNKDVILKDLIDADTGEKISISDAHAYTIKKVTDKGVVLVNPWDTSKQITLSRNDFLLNFYIMSCDLSEDNPVKSYIH